MPVLREVVTRFKFETDEQGKKKAQDAVKNMQFNIGKLGKLLGITLGAAGAKATFNLGQSAERASFSLRRLAGTDFDRLRKTFRSIQAEMNTIQEGSGNLIKRKEFDIAAAGFFREFKRGEGTLKFFREAFRFAAIESANTGRNVLDIFEGIQTALASGDFGNLLDLPGFDRINQQMTQFIQGVIDPGEPGGRIAIQNRMRKLAEIMSASINEQRGTFKFLPPEILEAEKASKTMKATLDELGRTMTELMVPVLQKMNVLLEHFLNLTEKINETNKGPNDSFLGRLGNSFVESNLEFYLGKDYKTKYGKGTAGGGGASIQQNNTIHVNGNNAETVAKEVNRQLEKKIGEASKAIVTTEDR